MMRYLYNFGLLAILLELSVITANAQVADTSILKNSNTHSGASSGCPLPPPPEKPEVCFVVEEFPLFPGCADLIATKEEKYQESQKKLNEYIYQHLEYPTEAKLIGVQGRVVIQFVVDLNGEITSAKCIKDIGYGCGAEALRVINSMNQLPENWTPAKRHGKPVAIQYYLPISFKL